MDKKRILIAVGGLLVALAILLVCQSVDRSTTVGICYAEDTTAVNSPYRTALEQALQEQGYRLEILYCHQDQAKQLEQICRLQDSCDALLIEPVMVSAAQELLSVLDSDPLPTVLLGHLPDASYLEGRPNLAGVGVDQTLPGTVLAELILQLPDRGDINGDGTVSYVLIQGVEGSQDTTVLSESFQKALSDRELPSHLLSVGYTDWSSENAQQVSEQLLSAYGKDIEVILCTDSQITSGVLSAADSMGRQTGVDVYLCALGADEALVQLAQQGRICGTVATDQTGRIQAAVEALTGLLSEQPGTFTYVTVHSPIPAIDS